MIRAHAGVPPAPHDVWTAWHADPLVVASIVLVAWVYRRGHARGRRDAVAARRARCFAGGLLALAVALLSPLDAASRALASAHMVQHLLVVLVAAPLLAFSAPVATLLRGVPMPARRVVLPWRRRLRLTRRTTYALRHPAAVWPAYVGTLWFWHSGVAYDAALRHEAVHALEHVSFLVTATLLWSTVVEAARTSPGFGVLFVFATATQSVFLAALLTFARRPWYAGYAATTSSWGLDHLADQQLAGVLMWLPGGVVYLGTAIALLVTWIRQSEQVA